MFSMNCTWQQNLFLNFWFFKKYIFSFAKNEGKQGKSTEKVMKKYENLFAYSCPGRFSWFFMVPGFVFHDSMSVCMVFHGSRLVLGVFHSLRLVFHGSRLVFHGSWSVLIVPGRFLWFFMVWGWFLMVPGQFYWFQVDFHNFFMVPGRFFIVPGWFFMVPGLF